MKKGFIVSCIVCLVITALMLSCTFQNSDSSIEVDSEQEQLKADIAVIESVELDNLQEFYSQNKEWVEDLNNRLYQYIANVSEDQKSILLKELRGDNSTTRSASDYFNSYIYHWRGGFWTYSMTPKMVTRLLRPYAAAGWNELAAIYSGIRNDNGSLSNQYWCHFDLFFEADWDIEEGRPRISYLGTLLSLCNPGGGD